MMSSLLEVQNVGEVSTQLDVAAGAEDVSMDVVGFGDVEGVVGVDGGDVGDVAESAAAVEGLGDGSYGWGLVDGDACGACCVGPV